MAYTKNFKAELSQDMADELYKIRLNGLTMSEANVNYWFAHNLTPSPTLFALDFGFDPALLPRKVQDEPLVRKAMYRIIGSAEELLFDKVFGPKAVIQRTELVMGDTSIKDDELGNAEDEESQGLFVSA